MMRLRRKLALLASASLAATALTVIGFSTAANADTANGEIRPLSGSFSGLFSNPKCLDLRTQDGVDSPHARIQQWDCSGANEQQFSARPFATVPTVWGARWVYQLVNLRSGQCVEVRDGLLSNGAQIDQFPCATGGLIDGLNARQLWLETRWNGTGVYQVQPWSALRAGVNMCLDVQGGSTTNGTKIQQYTCNGTGAQRYFGIPMVNDGAVIG